MCVCVKNDAEVAYKNVEKIVETRNSDLGIWNRGFGTTSIVLVQFWSLLHREEVTKPQSAGKLYFSQSLHESHAQARRNHFPGQWGLMIGQAWWEVKLLLEGGGNVS